MLQLWERARDFVLLGVLVLISLAVLFSQNSPLIRSARAVALEGTARLESVFALTGRYTGALDQNDRLRENNVELAAQVALLREARAENDRLRELIEFRERVGFPMLPARVVGKDITRQDNLLTLNVGTNNGVAIDMPVIDERGIVGVVVLVSENFSMVLPHQNTNFRVPAKIDLLQQDGVVRWDGAAYDRLLMEYVVRTEPVVRGQLVVTSGFSGIFPAGLPVGRVDTSFAARGRNDLIIYLEPAAPISRVDYVYVVLQQPDRERIALEQQPLR
jgi:rod shape-determining protein MreC